MGLGVDCEGNVLGHENVLCLDEDGSYRGVHIYQNLFNCTLKLCILFYVN